MKINEIKIGGIYKANLIVEFRSGFSNEKKTVPLFIRVIGKTSFGLLEITLLNDYEVHYLEPYQIENEILYPFRTI